jgi:hypothetical protein
MSLRPLIPVLVSALVLAGCASPSADLVPVPAADGAMQVSGDGKARLQVQVQNQGAISCESSPVTINFFLHKITVTSVIQDGGPLEPGESSRILEFDVPQDCLEGGCAFQVSVDPEKAVNDGNRSNNRARGLCEGRIAPTVDPPLGTAQ